MITAGPLSMQLSAVPRTQSPAAPARWQQLWRQALRDPQTLLARLDLDAAALGVSEAAIAQFALRVPEGFVARMRRGDAYDPLLRQVLPIDAEMRPV
ncbi:EF-P beta-lysylation protein EpmB, partial [Stenotrophomonas lactitubi]|nr:EF-P beta-lysylation protein EpmB [Stenotrophomonas lactitubi]